MPRTLVCVEAVNNSKSLRHGSNAPENNVRGQKYLANIYIYIYLRTYMYMYMYVHIYIFLVRNESDNFEEKWKISFSLK